MNLSSAFYSCSSLKAPLIIVVISFPFSLKMMSEPYSNPINLSGSKNNKKHKNDDNLVVGHQSRMIDTNELEMKYNNAYIQ